MNKDNCPRFALIVFGILLAFAIAGIGRMGWFARSGSEEFATSLHSLDQATLGLALDRRSPADQPSLLGQLMQQNPTALDDWLPGPTWVGRSLVHWLGNGGARCAGVLFVVITLISCLWKQNSKAASGQLLATSLLTTLVMLNIWVWAEPKIYESTRPKQQRLEQYIRSIDEYYEPFKA